jgi:hypothetical protein
LTAIGVDVAAGVAVGPGVVVAALVADAVGVAVVAGLAVEAGVAVDDGLVLAAGLALARGVGLALGAACGNIGTVVGPPLHAETVASTNAAEKARMNATALHRIENILRTTKEGAPTIERSCAALDAFTRTLFEG